MFKSPPRVATAHNTRLRRRHSEAVMLRWHFRQARSPTPKSVRPERVAENFDIFAFEPSAEELAQFDALDTGVRGGPARTASSRHGATRRLFQARDPTEREVTCASASAAYGADEPAEALDGCVHAERVQQQVLGSSEHDDQDRPSSGIVVRRTDTSSPRVGHAQPLRRRGLEDFVALVSEVSSTADALCRRSAGIVELNQSDRLTTRLRASPSAP
jgi:hypothetical protein